MLHLFCRYFLCMVLNNHYFCTMQYYHKVVLALGSNLGDKKNNLLSAITLIHNQIGFVVQASAVYETPSWGFNSYPFYNMCILIHTHLVPHKLLKQLKELEKKLGRTKKTTTNYEARTVDIDIIYVEDEIVDTPHLQIPHPEMQNRNFVLVPLNDLSIDWKHPVLHKTTAEILDNTTDVSAIKKVDNIVLPKEGLTLSRLNFIAIEGNIGSGKTTLVKKIAADFNGKIILERFADNAFLPKFYKDPNRYAFPLEMSFLADRYAQLNEDLNQLDLFSNFVISDYYTYKSLIFSQITLEKDEANLYRIIFETMYKETQKPDLYIFLQQTTENLLVNIKKRNRSYEENISADYLDKITQGYRNFIKTLPPEKVLVIDVSEKDFVANHDDYLNILQQIQNKINQNTINL